MNKCPFCKRKNTVWFHSVKKTESCDKCGMEWRDITKTVLVKREIINELQKGE